MRSQKSIRLLLVGLALTVIAVNGAGAGGPKGLNDDALDELSAAGVDKYLGAFTPIASTPVGDGWIRHDFDTAFGTGPICIAGTPYAAYTRAGNPNKLLILEQGGGACWQGFYNCNVLAEDQAAPPPAPIGIYDFDSNDNPFKNHSIVYMPYCDGSVFSGDNDVFDPAFGIAIGAPTVMVRFHRGLRNQSAAMDLAVATFPDAQKITVAGSSAGGVGAAAFAPFLVRFLYGNSVKINVFNDAGPVTVNLDPGNPAAQADIVARAADWQFGQFYPASCTDCDDMGQQTAIIKWRLDNDSDVHEAFYDTAFDFTNRFFTRLLFDAAGFRNLIVTEHGLLNAAHPDRYKRFIVSGDTSHTALQSTRFYLQDANGVFLSDWTGDFLKRNQKWVDIVEAP